MRQTLSVEIPFSPGETVWVMHDNAPRNSVVEHVEVVIRSFHTAPTFRTSVIYRMKLDNRDRLFDGSLVHGSKAELLASL